MVDRADRKAQVLEHLGTVLDNLTDAEFERLSGNGHEQWLQSELERAVHRVAGKNKTPPTGIRG